MYDFPRLPLDVWRATRDSLHQQAKVLGAIRRTLAPAQPHWWHVSLLPRPEGLSTGWLPMPGGLAAELSMDLVHHGVGLQLSDGRRWSRPLGNLGGSALAGWLLDRLDAAGSRPAIDLSKLDDGVAPAHDPIAATAWWQAARLVAGALTAFAAELPGKTSPVQLWPHHFDLSLNWFSGRLVPGQDPADEESSQEQMGFGFSTGDAGIPEPYLYLTAYPWPDDLADAELPAPAEWHLADWKGGLVRYGRLIELDRPLEGLMRILRAVHGAGAERMRD